MALERATFEVFKAHDGWRWRLLSRNAEIVAQSESYATRYDAVRGAKDARKTARFAGVSQRDTDAL